jgi:hypothetical protein
MDVLNIAFGSINGQRIVSVGICHPMIEGVQSLRSAMGNHVPYAIIDACYCPSKRCQYAVVLDEINISNWISHCFWGIAELDHLVQVLTSALLGDVDAVCVIDEVAAIPDL